MQRNPDAIGVPVELLRSFIALQEAGSLLKASRILQLTPAGIAAQLRRLQQLVGGDVFRKSAGAFIVTERGARLLDYARRMIDMNDQIVSLTGRHPSRRSIGIPKIYAAPFLTAAHRVCSEAMPDFVTTFSCDTSDKLAKALASDFLDVAILTEHQGLPTATEIVWDEDVVWAAAPDFALKPGCPIPVIRSPNGPADKNALDSLSRAGLGFEAIFVTTDWSIRVAAACAGAGYVAVPRRLVPDALEIVDDDLLPPIPSMRCGIHVRVSLDRRKIRPLLGALAQLFVPGRDRSSTDVAGSSFLWGEQTRVSNLTLA